MPPVDPHDFAAIQRRLARHRRAVKRLALCVKVLWVVTLVLIGMLLAMHLGL